MATWHQEKRGLAGLYRPDSKGWKVISNSQGEFASAIVFSTQAQAQAYLARCGGAIIPPEKRNPLFYVMLSYRTPSGRESCATFYIREADKAAAFNEAKRRLAHCKRRRIASGVSLARCDTISES